VEIDGAVFGNLGEGMWPMLYSSLRVCDFISEETWKREEKSGWYVLRSAWLFCA